MRFKNSWLAKVAVVALSALLVFGVPIAWATGQVITGTVNFNASFSEVSTAGLGQNTLNQFISQNLRYTNGTGSNAVDTNYAAILTLTAAPTTLDLTTLTDPTGASINFARVREFIVQNAATTAGFDVKVSGGASNGVAFLPPAANYIPCRYGAVVRISDPLSTGGGNGNLISGTTKTVTFDPGANTVTLYVLIVGGSSAFVLVIPFRLRRYRRRLAA